MSDFPDRMARGIRYEEWLNDKPPFRSAFFFDKETRSDGKKELSVVDLQFKGAKEFLLNQKYKGKISFPAGIAILSGDKIRKLIKTYEYPLSYEEKPTKNNPAHGNILLDKMKQFEERKVAARLAMTIIDIEKLCS